MKYIHNGKITVFLKPEEYFGRPELIENTKKAFHKLLPLDFDKEKLTIKEETVESFENRKIKTYTLEILKEAHATQFVKTLKELLKPYYETLRAQKSSRLDEDLFFYIRLNKELLMKDIVELTDSGDCFHIRIHIAAFPKNKEAGLKVVDEIFQ